MRRDGQRGGISLGPGRESRRARQVYETAPCRWSSDCIKILTFPRRLPSEPQQIYQAHRQKQQDHTATGPGPDNRLPVLDLRVILDAFRRATLGKSSLELEFLATTFITSESDTPELEPRKAPS